MGVEVAGAWRKAWVGNTPGVGRWCKVEGRTLLERQGLVRLIPGDSQKIFSHVLGVSFYL